MKSSALTASSLVPQHLASHGATRLRPNSNAFPVADGESQVEYGEFPRIVRADEGVPHKGILAEEPLSKANNSNLVIKCLTDAVFRGLIRYPEKLITNEYIRAFLYRPIIEFLRKLSESLLGNALEGKTTTMDDIKTDALRASEHFATFFVDPFKIESTGKLDLITCTKLVFTGLGNMGLRTVPRLAYYKAGITDKKELGLKHLPDDFFLRSAFRLIRTFSNNPLIKIPTLIAEQAGINLGLDWLKPVSRLFPGLSTKLEGCLGWLEPAQSKQAAKD